MYPFLQFLYDIKYASDGDVDGFFVMGVWGGVDHTEKVLFKTLRTARENDENWKKVEILDTTRVVES